MGLNVWDDLDDPYDHVELAQNWEKVDDHDHTTNKGLQIPTGGLSNLAVTTPKIADGAVVTGKIAVNGVETANLNNGAVTADKIATSVWAGVLPIGSIIPWYRPLGSSDPVPTGFVLCVGGTTSSHDFGVGGSIAIPNLVDRFLMGSNTGAGERATGGSNTKDLNHHHTIPSHTHNAPSHAHSIAQHNHGGATGGSTPGTSSAGTHGHTFAGGHGMAQRPYEISSGGTPRQAAYISGFNSGDTSASVSVDSAGAHSHTVNNHTHGIATDGATGTGLGGLAATSGVLESGAGLHTTGPNAALPTDFKPAYYGVLYIMKVRNKTA
jgi:hypothetical protein